MLSCYYVFFFADGGYFRADYVRSLPAALAEFSAPLSRVELRWEYVDGRGARLAESDLPPFVLPL